MGRFRSYPRHLRPAKGQGLVQCAVSGFLRRPEDIVEIDGRPVAKDKADWYGEGFGYDHPRDVYQAETGGDPSPVEHGGIAPTTSKADQSISDTEIRAAIVENRAPRRGF